MIKFIGTLFFILAACNVRAGSILDNTIFGISAISQDITLDVKLLAGTQTTSESGTGFGVYLDKYYKGKYRFNSTFSYVTYDYFDFSSLSLSADYLIPYNKELSFFAGATAGGAMQQYSGSSMSDASFGLIYGVQLGGIAYLTRNLMLELGFRQKSANIETEVTVTNISATVISEVDELYIGFLLMF